MTPGRREKRQFDPESYPALREFLPAYLHQDFGEAYGSPSAAFAALIADASADQVRKLREEWAALRRAFSGRPLHDLQRALTQLGAAWRPESEQEFQDVDEILTQAGA